jgi:8-oxo-dGTP diphosphatase
LQSIQNHSPIHVVCAVIEQNGLILCAQRSETMALPLKWEFPGGKIEPGEAEEPALKREIQEELNVEIEILERMPEHDYAYTPEKVIRLIPYRCTIKNVSQLQAREHAELRWVDRKKLLELDWAAADLPIVNDVIQNL